MVIPTPRRDWACFLQGSPQPWALPCAGHGEEPRLIAAEFPTSLEGGVKKTQSHLSCILEPCCNTWRRRRLWGPCCPGHLLTGSQVPRSSPRGTISSHFLARSLSELPEEGPAGNPTLSPLHLGPSATLGARAPPVLPLAGIHAAHGAHTAQFTNRAPRNPAKTPIWTRPQV